MVIELSFVCSWHLQIYPLKNARPFFYFLSAMNFSYCCFFYGLGKIAKKMAISKLWVFVIIRSLSCSFVQELNLKKIKT